MRFLNKKTKEKSFTLTEMLVVITMIVILIGIIIVGTEGSRALSRDKRRIADLAAYQVALQEYYSYYKAYPFNNCEKSTDDWVACGAPQTKEQCEAIVNSRGEHCQADTSGKTCTCPRADEFLGKLKTPPSGTAFLDPLPKDPKSDEDTAYVYVFPLPNRGRAYKIAAVLERDTQAMANDGGTNPPATPALYEVFSTLGASIAVDTSFFEGVSGELSCAVENIGSSSGSCPSGKTMILKLSSTTNAHAELVGGSAYSYAVCCSPSNLIAGSGTNFLKLSAATNAHVEKISGSAYSQNASFSSPSGDVQCNYFTNTCPTGTACLVSIWADTNAHIGDCNAYPTKICCLIK